MRAPAERVLCGLPRLYAFLERQRRENITAWAEGPGLVFGPFMRLLRHRTGRFRGGWCISWASYSFVL